jgi:hypothetical protein
LFFALYKIVIYAVEPQQRHRQQRVKSKLSPLFEGGDIAEKTVVPIRYYVMMKNEINAEPPSTRWRDYVPRPSSCGIGTVFARRTGSGMIEPIRPISVFLVHWWFCFHLIGSYGVSSRIQGWWGHCHPGLWRPVSTFAFVCRFSHWRG